MDSGPCGNLSHPLTSKRKQFAFRHFASFTAKKLDPERLGRNLGPKYVMLFANKSLLHYNRAHTVKKYT